MRFEHLEIWRRSKDLSVAVYIELRPLRDWGFKDQITRSMLSVPSNIAEGMEKKSSKEKYHYLSISKGSGAEFKTQAIIGKEIGYIKDHVADHWVQEIEEISKMIAGFQRKLN